MKHVVTADEMKERDTRTQEYLGVPSCVLMERAALAVADTIGEMIKNASSPHVLAVCGSGNNGGDGFACARILTMRGIPSDILFVGNRDHMTAETQRQASIAEKLSIPWVSRPQLDKYDVIVDAIFGTGLTRPVTGSYAEMIEDMNDSGVPIVSVDLPSGIEADTGDILGCAVRAEKTVTMQLLKPGLLLYPGAAASGQVILAEIGIQDIPSADPVYLLEPSDAESVFPHRVPYGNKGTFGKVLIVAGSKNMAGAAVLSARAALKSGAGMVKVLTEEINRPVIQASVPEALVSVYNTEEEAESALLADLEWCDVCAAGPGMGRGERTEKIVRYLLECASKPLILDADALNVLEGQTELLDLHEEFLAVTPHMGEMMRLTGEPIARLKEDPVREARRFARAHGVYCVMKDARTVTACPDGTVYLNTAGNDGMATAGSGDTLTGIVASFAAQHAEPEAAVLLHAMAGDAAAESMPKASMTAQDIIEGIKKCL